MKAKFKRKIRTLFVVLIGISSLFIFQKIGITQCGDDGVCNSVECTNHAGARGHGCVEGDNGSCNTDSGYCICP